MFVYLDNSSTTRPCEAAIEKVTAVLGDCFGNPSSLHELGLKAKEEVENSRKTLASFLSCDESEIYFTPSGTTANMTAILGTAKLKKREGRKIITSKLEHPSVLRNFELLKDQGYETVVIGSDPEGCISFDELSNAIDENTILVSCMAVNNETGAVQPFERIKGIIKDKKSGALFHCDAVQALGKIELKPSKLGIDLMTMSAHKIHGIKGAGAIYLNRNVRLPAVICGGGQEKGLVSGTEAVPAIAAFGAAVKDIGSIEDNRSCVRELNSYLREKFEGIEYISINSPVDALPYILNISVEGVPSQVMLNALSAEGIYVSAGSACSKGHRSDVLTAMGLSSKRIDSAVRISFSKNNTKDDADALYEAIIKTANRVRR
ncbi:MAG: cysteine desulfurase [Clostridiales bacterium]|nr:cysteine desulfurase [Clostridiales bacterium]